MITGVEHGHLDRDRGGHHALPSPASRLLSSLLSSSPGLPAQPRSSWLLHAKVQRKSAEISQLAGHGLLKAQPKQPKKSKADGPPLKARLKI